jgi:hypothetical protein
MRGRKQKGVSMSRYSNAYDDDNFKTITGLDGKPTRILKDRGRVRISMTMRDSLSALQRSVADDTARDTNRITDGRSDDPTALNRPGFRVPTVQDRRAVNDAYAEYQNELTNAYRRVGTQSEDDTQDHGQTTIRDRASEYAAYDAEISQAYLRKG